MQGSWHGISCHSSFSSQAALTCLSPDIMSMATNSSIGSNPKHGANSFTRLILGERLPCFHLDHVSTGTPDFSARSALANFRNLSTFAHLISDCLFTDFSLTLPSIIAYNVGEPQGDSPKSEAPLLTTGRLKVVSNIIPLLYGAALPMTLSRLLAVSPVSGGSV